MSSESTAALVDKWDSFIESMYEEQSQDIASIFQEINDSPQLAKVRDSAEGGGVHSDPLQRKQLKGEIVHEMATMQQYLKMQNEGPDETQAERSDEKAAMFLADNMARTPHTEVQKAPPLKEPTADLNSPWYMQKADLEQRLLQTLGENAQLKAQVMHVEHEMQMLGEQENRLRDTLRSKLAAATDNCKLSCQLLQQAYEQEANKPPPVELAEGLRKQLAETQLQLTKERQQVLGVREAWKSHNDGVSPPLSPTLAERVSSPLGSPGGRGQWQQPELEMGGLSGEQLRAFNVLAKKARENEQEVKQLQRRLQLQQQQQQLPKQQRTAASLPRGAPPREGEGSNWKLELEQNSFAELQHQLLVVREGLTALAAAQQHSNQGFKPANGFKPAAASAANGGGGKGLNEGGGEGLGHSADVLAEYAESDDHVVAYDEPVAAMAREAEALEEQIVRLEQQQQAIEAEAARHQAEVVVKGEKRLEEAELQVRALRGQLREARMVMSTAEGERREAVRSWARVERERRAMVGEEARSVAMEREWQMAEGKRAAEEAHRTKLETEVERRRLEKSVVAAKEELDEERRRRRDEEGRMRRELLAMTEMEEEERLREEVEEIRTKMHEDTAKWEAERQELLSRLEEGGSIHGGAHDGMTGSAMTTELDRQQEELHALMGAANEQQLKQAHERAELTEKLEVAESALDTVAEELDEEQEAVEEAEAAVKEARLQWEEDKRDLAQQVEQVGAGTKVGQRELSELRVRLKELEAVAAEEEKQWEAEEEDLVRAKEQSIEQLEDAKQEVEEMEAAVGRERDDREATRRRWAADERAKETSSVAAADAETKELRKRAQELKDRLHNEKREWEEEREATDARAADAAIDAADAASVASAAKARTGGGAAAEAEAKAKAAAREVKEAKQTLAAARLGWERDRQEMKSRQMELVAQAEEARAEAASVREARAVEEEIERAMVGETLAKTMGELAEVEIQSRLEGQQWEEERLEMMRQLEVLQQQSLKAKEAATAATASAASPSASKEAVELTRLQAELTSRREDVAGKQRQWEQQRQELEVELMESTQVGHGPTAPPPSPVPLNGQRRMGNAPEEEAQVISMPTPTPIQSPVDDDVQSPVDDDVQSPVDDDVQSPVDDDGPEQANELAGVGHVSAIGHASPTSYSGTESIAESIAESSANRASPNAGLNVGLNVGLKGDASAVKALVNDGGDRPPATPTQFKLSPTTKSLKIIRSEVAAYMREQCDNHALADSSAAGTVYSVYSV
jgi:hypothetical protein